MLDFYVVIHSINNLVIGCVLCFFIIFTYVFVIIGLFVFNVGSFNVLFVSLFVLTCFNVVVCAVVEVTLFGQCFVVIAVCIANLVNLFAWFVSLLASLFVLSVSLSWIRVCTCSCSATIFLTPMRK